MSQPQKQLFKLKYIEGVSEPAVLTDLMHLPPEQTSSVIQELDATLKLALGEITPETVHDICPECFSTDLEFDAEKSEKICRTCGVVATDPANLDVSDMDMSLPWDVTLKPTSEMSTDHSLGNTLSKKDLINMSKKLCKNSDTDIARFQRENPDIAAELAEHEFVICGSYVYRVMSTVPATPKKNADGTTPTPKRQPTRFVRKVTVSQLYTSMDRCFHEADLLPRVQKMSVTTNGSSLDTLLHKASALSRQYGLGSSRTHSVFNNTFAKNVRRIYRMTRDFEYPVSANAIVETVFYHTLSNEKACWGKQVATKCSPKGQYSISLLPSFDTGLYAFIEDIEAKIHTRSSKR